MCISNFLSGTFVSILFVLIIPVYVYFKLSFNYWSKKHLPHLNPKIPFGNIAPSTTGKEHISITIKHLYDIMKRKHWKHGGIYMFTSPTYVPINLDYIKNVLTRDFQYFTDRPIYYNENDPLDAHLIHLEGEKWNNLRNKLTPAFTTMKIKSMFQTIANCETDLLAKMNEESKKQSPIDIKQILASFTIDIIGSCCFGLECNAFEENSLFCKYGKKVFEINKLERLKAMFCSSFPRLALSLNISTCPKGVTEFFVSVVKDAVNYREKNNYRRHDFIQLLIDMKDAGSLTIEEVAAQCFVCFIAGFETASSLMTFALYELGRNPSIQDKVRGEINSLLAQQGGKISYDAIQDMKYLDQVIDETLRMYPPAPHINRKCVKEYKVPGEDIVIEEGTQVVVPILGIHYDPEYYPDPEKFDPERFTEKNKSERHNYAHIPFGEGPRICIGKRLGLLQAKVGLSCLIKNFKFTVNPKTQEPLQMQPSPTILAAVGEIWLNVEKI